MKSLPRFKTLFKYLLTAAFALTVFAVVVQRNAHGQQLFIDFRFDGQTGAAATTQTLASGSAGQTYTIDMWATVVPAAATANTNLGLQSFGVRGASDITVGGGAFATGAGIGVGANPPGSFGQLAPFNPAGFTQPKVSDLGSTTNNGTSITNSTADGILDFGGTLATQKFTSLSNTGGLIFGGGATGQANPTGGWEWEVAQFKFTTGQASTTAGATTLFVPLQLSAGTATAATFSTNGATAVNLPVTVGSSLTFVIGGGGGGGPTIGIAMTAPTLNARFMQSQTYTGALAGTISNTAAAGSSNLNTAVPANVTASVTGTGNSIAALATVAATVAPGANTGYSGNLVTGTGTGAQTVTTTETDATATNSPQSATQTINILAPRSVTVSSGTPGESAANPVVFGGAGGSLGNAFSGVSVSGTASLVTTGADTSTTRVNVAATVPPNGDGIGVSSSNQLFNSAASTSTETLSGTFTGAGSGSVSIPVTTAEAAATNDTTAYAALTVFYKANIGSAVADNSGSNSTFGAALNATVAHNGSYAGLESKVTSLSGSGGSDARDASGNGGFAVILAGNNANANGGGAATPSMAWRTRTAAEAAGGATVFAPSLLKPTTGLISDVVSLTGLTAGSEAAGGATDPFVFEMSYNPALLPKGSTTNGHTTPSTLEPGLIGNKLIKLISLSTSGPTNGLWEQSVDENTVGPDAPTGNVVTSPLDPNYGVHQDWASFAMAKFGTTTPTNAQLGSLLGAWGIDTTGSNHEVWAIVNHNSQFAVVPEPSSLLLAGFGLLGLFGLRRRMKKSA